MNSETILVVAAVLWDGDGGLLLGQRPAHKRHGGLWEFPGGKVDDGETLAEAVHRELAEELAVAVDWVAAAPVFRTRDPGHPYEILFLPTRASGSIALREHSAVAWLRPGDTAGVALAPSDEAFLKAVASGRVKLGGLELSPLALP